MTTSDNFNRFHTLKMKISLVEVFVIVCVDLGFVNHHTENSTETVLLYK